MTLSASQNANSFFETRTKLKIKEEKTVIATQQSLKKAHQSALSEIKNKKLQTRKKKVMAHRKSLWFEKFFWFLSSENYLVITARDAQQNEIIIKKYLKPNDIVFHAQIQGAAFCVVKNTSDKPIPNMTILETASASLAHSRAWEDKVIIQVYWVHANQISKTAPTGMFLPTGSFMVYGKKNFVQPFKLEMGYGLLFKIDEENIVNHKNERNVKEEMDLPAILEEKQHKNELFAHQNDESQNQDPENEKNEEDKKEPDFEEIQIQKKLKIGKQMSKKQEVKAIKKQKIDESKIVKNSDKPKTTNKKLTKLEKEKIDKYLEKYGDEDEDEQELRMKILGTKKNFRVEEQKKTFVWNHMKTSEEFIKEGGEMVHVNFEQEPEQKPTKPGKKKNIQENVKIDEKEIKNEKQENDNEKKNEKQENQKVNQLVEPIENEDEEIEALNYANLTGIPLKDDCLYEAYPVCAPYSTLLKYKYKIKLLPGTMKRGKVLKLSVDLFSSQTDINEVC